MADYGSFQHGGVTYPLTAATTNSLLTDADPALALASGFFAGVLQIYLGARLAAEGSLVGLTFANAVGKTLSVEPTPVFLANEMRWPVLALYRRSQVVDEHTIAWEKDVGTWELAYLLPPMTPRQTDRLDPVLRSVTVVLAHAITQGYDPAYLSGAKIWAQAGIKRARMVSAKWGPYDLIESTTHLYRAVNCIIEVEERDMPFNGALDVFAGTDLAIDQVAPDRTVNLDLADVATAQAPTLTAITATSGTKAGGVSVTLTGTGFKAPAQVTIGGVAASAVVVVSPTSITCVTPAHAAYPSFMADVVVTNADGQSATLIAGYTFT